MNTLSTENQHSDILHWIKKRSARSVLVIAFLSLVIGVVALVIGDMILSKIIFLGVLLLMGCSLALGLTNMLLAHRKQNDG